MAALACTLTIDGRPAPAEMIAAFQSVDVDSSVEAASTFRLRLGITQNARRDWTLLERDLFKPLARVAVRIAANSKPPVLVLNGYAAGQRVLYSDRPGGSVLEVDGMDTSLLMNLEERVVPWKDQSDSKIATQLFRRHGLHPSVETTSPVLAEPEGTTVQRATDIRFLRRLARRNGFECYVRPGIPKDVGVFRPPPLSGTPQAVLSVAMGDETNVSDFSVRYEMAAPTAARGRALDVAAKTFEQGEALTASQKPLGSSAALDRIRPKQPLVLTAETALVRGVDLKRLAQAIVDRSGWVVVAEGEVGQGVGVMEPGVITNVRGPGKLFNGSYYVTRVRHRVDLTGYTQRFEARRNAVEAIGTEVYR
jgi:phage protein D